MACILFVYTRTSIRAAKENAQRHRDADSGGQGLDLYNEQRRRHGRAERLEKGGNSVTELAGEARRQLLGSKGKEAEKKEQGTGGKSDEEERLRALKEKMGKRTNSGDE
ncbi:hypothetical protein KC330_g3012 [Hortaea werneckii]|nr:hypothetical protein KC330_g3012 [Hortaea werneckii]